MVHGFAAGTAVLKTWTFKKLLTTKTKANTKDFFIVQETISFKEWAKTEGQLHKLHKESVAEELQKQNYTIYFEPLESPLKLLCWHSYRPDILAIKQSNPTQKIVLVECETHPNRKRVLTKKKQIKKNIALQKQLLKNTTVLPLLVIPPNNLQKMISSPIRRFWEIWIINEPGQIKHKISRNN
jgi:hypothetical protein